MSLQVCVMTPEKIFWNGQSAEIILPTNTGEMGVLKNHAPIITGLDVGAMLIRTEKGWTSVARLDFCCYYGWFWYCRSKSCNFTC